MVAPPISPRRGQRHVKVSSVRRGVANLDRVNHAVLLREEVIRRVFAERNADTPTHFNQTRYHESDCDVTFRLLLMDRPGWVFGHGPSSREIAPAGIEPAVPA